MGFRHRKVETSLLGYIHTPQKSLSFCVDPREEKTTLFLFPKDTSDKAMLGSVPESQSSR